MSSASEPLRGAVVGARMGAAHARVIASLDELCLAAICDLDEARARSVAEQFPGATAYVDYELMLRAERPDVVAVATPTDSHARLTVTAAEAGVCGICCEKPMATCMADGRRMVAACRERGVCLVVNHQRCMSGPLVQMRRLIADGSIGDLYLVRASCAGDVLSDGTHCVDSVRWLAGGEEVSWVLAQVYRGKPNPSEARGMGYTTSGGYRYGHPVETGAVAVFEFSTRVRAELLCGGAQLPGRQYQDYEVFGTKGGLWRQGDRASPPVLIRDGQGGGWREAPLERDLAEVEPMTESYRALARMLRGTAVEPHPLSGDSALKDLEVVMAIYESARTNSRVQLPLHQDRFPLQLMVDEGRL